MSSISGASSASNPYVYLNQNGQGAKKTASNQAQGKSAPPASTPPAPAATTSAVDSDGDHDGSSFSVKA